MWREANENAIKLARFFTGRHKIMARYRSYHGVRGRDQPYGDPRDGRLSRECQECAGARSVSRYRARMGSAESSLAMIEETFNWKGRTRLPGSFWRR